MTRDDSPTPIPIPSGPAGSDRIAAVYRCHRQLADLRDTDDADVKYCDTCRQKVFRVHDFDGLERAVASRGCVWGPIEMPLGGDAKDRFYLGAPALGTIVADGLSWDD